MGQADESLPAVLVRGDPISRARALGGGAARLVRARAEDLFR
jgi:F420-0:gamma-glutamyl ligase